jgi:fructose/tagatose bisphosphate aldolase
MTVCDSARDLFERLNGAVRLNADRTLAITDADRFRNELVDVLVATAVFSRDASAKTAARWLIWEGAHAMGAHSASIQGLYSARGRGKTPNNFTVPAVNIRGMTYDFARTMFRAAHALDVGAFVFEIAKSEMGYTDQRPDEYATCVMAAAIKERHHGPVFIQGDHFQFNAGNFAKDPEKEAQGIRDLIIEAIAAGFYNIDIDSSTLVDLSFPTLDEQQKNNYARAAEMTAWVRKHEPAGLTISVGGEIGEVGHKNSTVEELRACMDGYNRVLQGYGDGLAPISKVSVQTGTSHGGLPTPDGKVADVKLDFQVLEDLSRVAREQYGMAGAVQHGASTLPDELFHHFPQRGTAEIHLATGFQNLMYDGGFLPQALLDEMHEWLRQNCADEKTPDQTDEQFLYKTRKKAYGPFKRQLSELTTEKERYLSALQAKLEFLFDKLNMRGTRSLVDQNVKAVLVHRPLPEGAAPALGQTAGAR